MTTTAPGHAVENDSREIGISPGPAGLALAVFYAVFVRFYQAAGGRIGLPGRIDGPEGLEWASFKAGVLILAGGAACMVLTNAAWRTAPSWWPRIGGRELPRRIAYPVFVAPCVAGGVFAICHCIGAIVTDVLELADVITIEKSLHVDPTAAETRAGDLWNIFLYEPWFGAMGTVLLLCARSYAIRAGARRETVRAVRLASAVAIVLLSGAAIASICAGKILSV